MEFCKRHQDNLEMELELRGFLRPISLESEIDLSPLNHAKQLIINHCTNFAGKGIFHMTKDQWCPLCYVNTNPANVNCDNWVELAAEETLQHSVSEDVEKKVLVS